MYVSTSLSSFLPLGTSIPESYAGTVTGLTVYEGAGLPSTGSFPSWYSGYSRYKFQCVAYSVPTAPSTAQLSSMSDACGSVYVTNAGLPNPYDTLPTYYDSLFDSLAIIAGKWVVVLQS